MRDAPKAIALGARLSGCRNVLTLGVRPSFSDYTNQESDMILSAEKIYYPSTFYADLFDAMGKDTFPSYHTYRFVQDKIRQTALFHMMKIPHPKTRVYYGKKRKQKILDHFDFPFVAKIPRGSAKGDGVYLIRNRKDLDTYLLKTRAAYVQEYLETDRDIRVVIIGREVVHAYWRVAAQGDFRTNIAAGGSVLLDPVPEKATELALSAARKCQWDDVGIDVICSRGRYYILEANMKYGREGFSKAGIDYVRLMESLIEKGQV